MFFVVIAVAPAEASTRLAGPESHLQPKAKGEGDAAPCRRAKNERLLPPPVIECGLNGPRRAAIKAFKIASIRLVPERDNPWGVLLWCGAKAACKLVELPASNRG
jgi:hypothetical protein